MERLYMPYVDPVRFVVTHFRPHLDELGAWWAALRFGEHVFPGMKDAKLLLWNAGQKTPDGRTPQQWRQQDHAVLLGVGGGRTPQNPEGADFDEHGLKEITSTFTLMMEALGLANESSLQPSYRYILGNDREGKTTPWAMANILKTLNAYTISPVQVAQFTFECMDAHYNRMLKGDRTFAGAKHAIGFDAFLAQWLWDFFAGSSKAKRPQTARAVVESLHLEDHEDLSQIINLARRDHTGGCVTDFDVLTMFSEMVENGADSAKQYEFVDLIMNANFAHGRRLVQAHAEVRMNALVTWVGDPDAITELQKPRTNTDPKVLEEIKQLEESDAAKAKDADTLQTIKELKAGLVRPPVIGHRDRLFPATGIRPQQVISIISDNDEIFQAMRMKYDGATFTIKVTHDGHALVNGPKALMDSVAAQIRINEHNLREGHDMPRPTGAQLRQAGNLPGDPWCYHREGGNMMAGSLTAPTTPVPLTKFNDFFRIIAKALQYESRDQRWLRARTAKAKRSKPAA